MKHQSSKGLNYFASAYAVFAFIYAFFVLLSGCEDDGQLLRKQGSKIENTITLYEIKFIKTGQKLVIEYI